VPFTLPPYSNAYVHHGAKACNKSECAPSREHPQESILKRAPSRNAENPKAAFSSYEEAKSADWSKSHRSYILTSPEVPRLSHVVPAALYVQLALGPGRIEAAGGQPLEQILEIWPRKARDELQSAVPGPRWQASGWLCDVPGLLALREPHGLNIAQFKCINQSLREHEDVEKWGG
jgi:hypothetical protein